MKEITAAKINQKLVQELTKIGYIAPRSMVQQFQMARKNEKNEIARDLLTQLMKNIKIAKEKNFPLCQDTGLVVFWVRIGKNVSLRHLNLNKIVNDAVQEAFQKNNYRSSIVQDPLHRVNTRTNTPALIHYELTEGDSLEMRFLLKGGGCENMSTLKMLDPSSGIQGIRDFVLETVQKSGGKACPPLYVGVGIGGNFESVAWLAKKSLFRLPKEINTSQFWLEEEDYLFKEINNLGLGPLGLGGKTTSFKVNIEVLPCHIASLPVAVNLECHAHRLGHIKI